MGHCVRAAERRSTAASDLLLVDFEGVAILHLERLGVVGCVDALPVEEKADASRGLALALTESVHKLLELRGPLDLEEDFVVVIRHLNVKVLGLRVVMLRRAVVRHFC